MDSPANPASVWKKFKKAMTKQTRKDKAQPKAIEEPASVKEPIVPQEPPHADTKALFKKLSHYKNGKAVLIGINYRGTDSELNGCINDVKNMYDYLTVVEQFDPNNIIVLTDESSSSLQRLPTNKNILANLRWLVNGNDGTDNISLFLHYSGHGSYMSDTNKDETDGKDECICPLDYAQSGFIIDDVLRAELLPPIKNKPNVTLTCVFDSCHSGSILDMRYTVKLTRDSDSITTLSIIENKQYDKSDCEVICFSGCMDSQTSADAYINGKSQGMLTCAFLTTLSKYRKSSTQLTFKKFIGELQAYAATNGYEHVPQLSFNKYFDVKQLYAV